MRNGFLIMVSVFMVLVSLRGYAGQSFDYQSLDILMKSDIHTARAVVTYGAHMSSRCGDDMSVDEISKSKMVFELSKAYKAGDDTKIRSIMDQQGCYIFSRLNKNLDLLKSKLTSKQACLATEEKLMSLNIKDADIKAKLAGKASLELLCNENKVAQDHVVRDIKTELEKAGCKNYQQAAHLLVSENPFRQLKGDICVSALSFIDELENKTTNKEEG